MNPSLGFATGTTAGVQAGSGDRTSEGSRRATGQLRLIFDSGEREYGRGTTQRNQRSGLGNDCEVIPRGR